MRVCCRQFPCPRERPPLRARGEQRRWRAAAAAAPGAAKCPSPPLRPPTHPPACGQRPWPRAPRSAPRTLRPVPPPSPQIRATAASLTWRRRPPATPATAPALTATAAATATAVGDAAESKTAARPRDLLTRLADCLIFIRIYDFSKNFCIQRNFLFFKKKRRLPFIFNPKKKDLGQFEILVLASSFFFLFVDFGVRVPLH